MRKSSLVACLFIVPFLALTTAAQSFPWQDFKPRTIADLVKIDSKEIADSMHQTSLIVHADPLFSVVKVKYTGKSRAINPLKKDLLQKWGAMMGQQDQYVASYENDYLFTESGVDYWLPFRKK